MRRFKKLLVSLSLFLSILIVSSGVTSFAILPEGIKLGGSYSEVLRQDYDHEKYQVHHLISKEAWNRLADEIERREGLKPWNKFILCDAKQGWAPSILMEKEDHMKTQSYWNKCCSESEGMRSRDYIDCQTDGLIMFGNVNYLLRKECEDIREKFGGKYDEAIQQMYNYANPIIKVEKAELTIINPENSRWFVRHRI